MQRTFRSYTVIWAICLVLFNIIAFVTPLETKRGFWLGYIFITLAFLAQWFCARLAFKAETAQTFFYKFPVLSVSAVGVCAMLLIGGAAMAIPAIPVWVGAVLCCIVAGVTAIAVINASVAGNTVAQVDIATQNNTAFIKTLRADAESLCRNTASDTAKAIAQRVLETIRYSDPVSNESLRDVESDIAVQFQSFAAALRADDVAVTEQGETLIRLIQDRNTKCKLLK